MKDPGADTPLGGDYQRFLFLANRYGKPYWRSILLLVLGSFVISFLLILTPFILAPILDIILGRNDGVSSTEAVSFGDLNLSNIGTASTQWLGISPTENKLTSVIVLSTMWAVTGIFIGLVTFGNYLIALRVRVWAARNMQYDLYKHIMSLSLDFFHRQRVGELMSRLDTDTLASTAALQTIATTVIVAPILILFFGYLIVKTSILLVIASFAGVILHFIVTRGIQNPIRRRITQQFTAAAEMKATLQESLLSIRVVKSFGAEKFELKKLGSKLSHLVRTNIRYGIFKHLEEPARTGSNRIIEAGVIIISAYVLLQGSLDVAVFFVFGYLARSIMEHISRIGGGWVQIQGTLAAFQRVSELFSERSLVKDGPIKIRGFKQELLIKKVSFRYDTREVLKDIDLQIKKGEIVALVGPSGAGKSTLCDLVLRFYDGEVGSIRIDGQDLRTLNQQSYRSLFGVVPQESLLFNTTIRKNIAYVHDEASEREIILAAKTSNAHEFILGELPNGYDTLVGDRGVRLSGGQRQRIALARAIVGKPSILILDEATSSLDTESERLVQEAIDKVIHGTTALIIAHRLSTIQHADKIVVMNNGQIEAIGQHEMLLNQSPTYQNLHRGQFNHPG